MNLMSATFHMLPLAYACMILHHLPDLASSMGQHIWQQQQSMLHAWFLA